MTKNSNSIRFNEWGDTLFFIDKDILSNLKDVGFNIDYSKTDRFWFNLEGSTENIDNWFSNQIFDLYGNYGIDDVISLVNKLNLMVDSKKEMSVLLKYAVNKEYSKYLEYILGNMYTYVENNITNDVQTNLNLVKTNLFVVKDLKPFIKAVNEEGYQVNGGPQKWRSQINTINGILINLDQDFRKSLYNHNQYHVKNGSINKRNEISKSKFSFNNIHMNLGNVRWYSTKIDRINMSKKIIQRIETKNSFKPESELFMYLSRYLKESPLNEQTELEIENFLLNYYNNKPTKDNMLIKFDLFSNKKKLKLK